MPMEGANFAVMLSMEMMVYIIISLTPEHYIND